MKPGRTSVREAGRRLGVHENTIRNWMDSGLLDFERLPSGFRRPYVRSVEQLEASMAAPVLRDLAARLRAAGPSEEWTALPHEYKSRRVALVVAGQIRRGERAGWGPRGSFDARFGDDCVEVRFLGEPDGH